MHAEGQVEGVVLIMAQQAQSVEALMCEQRQEPGRQLVTGRGQPVEE